MTRPQPGTRAHHWRTARTLAGITAVVLAAIVLVEAGALLGWWWS